MELKSKHRGAGSPVFGAAGCGGDRSAFGVVVGLISNSECTQKDGADEQKHCAHRQDIQPQGKVHVRASLMVDGAI
jgi:hypothetical protein